MTFGLFQQFTGNAIHSDIVTKLVSAIFSDTRRSKTCIVLVKPARQVEIETPLEPLRLKQGCKPRRRAKHPGTRRLETVYCYASQITTNTTLQSFTETNDAVTDENDRILHDFISLSFFCFLYIQRIRSSTKMRYTCLLYTSPSPRDS